MERREEIHTFSLLGRIRRNEEKMGDKRRSGHQRRRKKRHLVSVIDHSVVANSCGGHRASSLAKCHPLPAGRPHWSTNRSALLGACLSIGDRSMDLRLLTRDQLTYSYRLMIT